MKVEKKEQPYTALHNQSPSCWELVTAPVRDISSRVLDTIYRPDPHEQPKKSFSRGPGYWSTPADETDTGFFTQLTTPADQRGDWYTVTPYVAEFWSTVSNAGFFAVAAKYSSPELVVAGTVSAISHIVPKQCLILGDRVGAVGSVLSLCIRNYSGIMANPCLAVTGLTKIPRYAVASTRPYRCQTAAAALYRDLSTLDAFP